jgi:hypothetical protein
LSPPSLPPRSREETPYTLKELKDFQRSLGPRQLLSGPRQLLSGKDLKGIRLWKLLTAGSSQDGYTLDSIPKKRMNKDNKVCFSNDVYGIAAYDSDGTWQNISNEMENKLRMAIMYIHKMSPVHGKISASSSEGEPQIIPGVANTRSHETCGGGNFNSSGSKDRSNLERLMFGEQMTNRTLVANRSSHPTMSSFIKKKTSFHKLKSATYRPQNKSIIQQPMKKQH